MHACVKPWLRIRQPCVKLARCANYKSCLDCASWQEMAAILYACCLCSQMHRGLLCMFKESALEVHKPWEGTAFGVQVLRQALLACFQLLTQHAQVVQTAIYTACLQNIGILSSILHDLLPGLVDAIKALGFLQRPSYLQSHISVSLS